ncbi:MAG: hypothetical protein HC810_01655, partial [Acaryochloridaceae cyanobacterium RL_2_7]|nr:hypothetical protein [Acaryochloridaceae cyanobacterium RL_2_7]
MSTLNGAIDALERNSADWQSVLQDTTEQLTKDAQSTVRNEIANLLNRLFQNLVVRDTRTFF